MGTWRRVYVGKHDMRFTIVDAEGAVSFVADGFYMQPLVALCARNPTSLDDLLSQADQIDRRLRITVRMGLAVFDEHNVPGNYAAILREMETTELGEEPVFRVVDDLTRQRSLEPTKTGLLIFNLKDHRIVQVVNHFYQVDRTGEAHLHDGLRYSRRTVRYTLPDSWSIVP
jgi:hypothetical protein